MSEKWISVVMGGERFDFTIEEAIEMRDLLNRALEIESQELMKEGSEE